MVGLARNRAKSAQLELGKRSFLIRGLELGEIIPFPVWIIPFPVLKINFETLGSNEKKFCKRSFLIRGLEVGEIIPFPV